MNRGENNLMYLAYLEFGVTDTAAWFDYCRDILGMMTSRDIETGAVTCRLDEYPMRLKLSPAPENSLQALGWEVADECALALAGEALSRAGCRVDMSVELAEEKKAAELLVCADPAGNQLHLFYGMTASPIPFESPQNAKFVTGDCGMGHILLSVPDHDSAVEFYTDIMGFTISDVVTTTDRGDITFLNCNPRHHSLALVAAPGFTGCRHLMVEVTSLDTLGAAMDRCIRENILSREIGRHSNDEMISFYSVTPSGFMLEYGWDGLRIDPSTWEPRRLAKSSHWGHRVLVPPDRDMGRVTDKPV